MENGLVKVSETWSEQFEFELVRHRTIAVASHVEKRKSILPNAFKPPRKSKYGVEREDPSSKTSSNLVVVNCYPFKISFLKGMT